MNFVALLVALAIAHFFQIQAKLPVQRVLTYYLNLMEKLYTKLKLKPKWAYFSLLLVLPIVLGLMSFTLNLIFFGLIKFIFASFILLCCLGDFHFTRQTELKPEASLNYALNYVFAVIFWFALFGATGAILYTVNRFIIKHAQARYLPYAKRVQALLNWVPSRLLALSFALVGQFKPVTAYWLERVLTGIKENQGLLLSCAQLAYGQAASEQAQGEDFSLYLQALLNRALIAWIVVLALQVLW